MVEGGATTDIAKLLEGVIAATFFITSKIVNPPYAIDNKSRVEIENAVSSYLMNNGSLDYNTPKDIEKDNEDLAYNIPKDIEIKFDKSSDFYIATVSFENTTKKAHVFVSKDKEVIGSTNK